MANHRTPDDVTRRDSALDSAVRTTSTGLISPRATSLWTYGAAPVTTSSIPAPRTATPPSFPQIPGDVTAPAGPAPSPTTHRGPATIPPGYRSPTALVPLQAGPAPLSPAHGWAPPVLPTPAAPAVADESDVAHRSAPDEIESRATTTLIPSSPGARRSRSGPVFVDGSGRRARRFKGVAAAAAALAAGYVGVVVTGALAGATGPALNAVPVSSGASLAPATPVLGPAPAVVPKPVLAEPADVTTTKPARATTTTPKRTAPRVAPKKVAPRVVAPVAPVVPAPPAPVVPAPAAPVAPTVPAVPAAPAAPTATNPTTPDTTKSTNRGNRGAGAAAPNTLAT